MKNKIALILAVLLLTGCGKVVFEVVGEPEVTYHSDPINVIVTGNPTTTVGIPSGNYIVSGDRLIVY